MDLDEDNGVAAGYLPQLEITEVTRFCLYLVALHQDGLHLFQQVLQVPDAQRLGDLHQGPPRHVSDLLETVPQQHAHFDQDATRQKNKIKYKSCFV